jgi:hypothetical protein
MSTPPARHREQRPKDLAMGDGPAAFAGSLMIVVGILRAVSGLMALIRNEVYPAGFDHVVSLDATSPRIYRLGGILDLVAGGAVLTGRLWGRLLGSTLAILSTSTNVLFIPNAGR